MEPQIYAAGAGHLPTAGLPGREPELTTWQRVCADTLARGRVGALDTILIGHRGVGKTVTMKACALAAHKQGFARLSLQATPDATLSGALLRAAEEYDTSEHRAAWAKLRDTLGRITSVSGTVATVGGSISLAPPDAHPGQDPYNASAVSRALADLAADLHTATGGGLMLCIDELQMLAPADMRTLGGVLNDLNNWHPGARVVFLATGLPNTMSALVGPDLERPHISNPARLFTTKAIPSYLSQAETAQALRGPSLQRGIDWTDAAVVAVKDLTGGYPAHLQVLAEETWTLTPAGPVDSDQVNAAAAAAQDRVDTMFAAPRWDRLGPQQKAYLAALALAGGEARSGHLAAMLDTSSKSLSGRRDRLIRTGDIYTPRAGWVALSQPMMATYMLHAYRDLYVDDSHDKLPSLEDMAHRRDHYVDGRTRTAPTDAELDRLRQIGSTFRNLSDTHDHARPPTRADSTGISRRDRH